MKKKTPQKKMKKKNIDYFKESIIVPKNTLSKVKKTKQFSTPVKKTPLATTIKRGAKDKDQEFMKYLQGHRQKKHEIINNFEKESNTLPPKTSVKDKLLHSLPNYFKSDMQYKVHNLIKIFKDKPSIINIKDDFSIVLYSIHYPDTSIIEILSWLIDYYNTENYFTEDEVIKFVLDAKVPRETGRFALALLDIIAPKKSLEPMITGYRLRQAKLIFDERQRYLEDDAGIPPTYSPQKRAKDNRFLKTSLTNYKKEEEKKRRRARQFRKDQFPAGRKERRRARQISYSDLEDFREFMKEKDEEEANEDSQSETLVADDNDDDFLGDERDTDVAKKFLVTSVAKTDDI